MEKKDDSESQTYLENLMHELKLVPVPFAKIKIRITFPFQVRNFVTLICQLRKNG